MSSTSRRATAIGFVGGTHPRVLAGAHVERVGARRFEALRGVHREHLHPVGELDEPLAAREELGAEVRGDPEGMDVDVELIDNACCAAPRFLVHVL